MDKITKGTINADKFVVDNLIKHAETQWKNAPEEPKSKIEELEDKISELEQTISYLAFCLDLKVSKDQVIDAINASAEDIRIKGDKLIINEDTITEK